jgi:hypothetical protein
MVRLLIAGVDRWKDYMKGTLTIDKVLTYEVDTAKFQVRGQRPQEGDEVIIEDDAIGRLFAGVIVKVELVSKKSRSLSNVWEVDCDDYTPEIDKKLVVETYQNMTADAIFRDIVAKYCPGFTTNGVQSGAPTVELLVFDYIHPSECFKQLCDYVGWQWYVDEYKDLHFFSVDKFNQPAPIKLVPGGPFHDFKYTIDKQGLRNRVYVRGGTMLSDPFTYELVADGASRIWPLPHKPHDLSMKISGNPVTVGIENVDDESAFDFLVNSEEKYVRASNQTDTPQGGATLSWTYKYDIDVITTVEDLDSQQSLRAAEGGDGVYEHVIVDQTLTTLDAAEAAGQADLREHANPKLTGSFATELVSGWYPGQLVTINLDDYGINNTFLIQRVSISREETWRYEIQFGGQLVGIADVLKALVSEQQKKQVNQTALLHKFIYGAEDSTITDEVAAIAKTPPWTTETSIESFVSNKNMTITESANADFSLGNLSNVTADASGIRLANDATTTEYVLKFQTTLSGSGGQGTNSYFYNDIWNGNVAIASGDKLEYEIAIDPKSNAFRIGVDGATSDGKNIRDNLPARTDQNGVGVHPSEDLSGYAKGKWYKRIIDLSGWAGKTLTSIQVANETDIDGTYTAYFRNVVIKDALGNVKAAIFTTTLNNTSTAASSNGSWSPASSTNWTCLKTVITNTQSTYKTSGSRISPAYSIGSVGKYGNSSFTWESNDIDGYYFDGQEYSYIYQPSTTSLQITGDLTIEFRMVAFNIGSGRLNPVHKCYGGEFALTIEPDGSMNYYHGNAGQDGVGSSQYVGINVAGAGTFTNGRKYHVALVRAIQDKSIKLYVNGNLVSTNNWSTIDPIASSLPFLIGKGYTGQWIDAIIDDVRIWNVPRTQQQIKDNMNKQLQGNEFGLAGYWKLDNGTGATDASGFNTGGIVCGNATWAKLTTTIETSADGGITWKPATNGQAIANFESGADLTGKTVMFRQTLTTTDSRIAAKLWSDSLFIDSQADLEIDVIGQMLNVWNPTNSVWPATKYQTSTDGGQTWSQWTPIDDSGAVEIPEGCKLRIKTAQKIKMQNWKKPLNETDAVCGFVVA